MLEKRKFKRISLNVRLFYKVQRPPEVSLKVGDKEITTQTLDLSQGGMGLVTSYEGQVFSFL
jgi:c-di-GMP-binding flagellar brake protein YcgR